MSGIICVHRLVSDITMNVPITLSNKHTLPHVGEGNWRVWAEVSGYARYMSLGHCDGCSHYVE
jgi:hypothetical protein